LPAKRVSAVLLAGIRHPRNAGAAKRQLVSDILYTKNQRLGAVEDQASARAMAIQCIFF